jgi:hypothetical protein
MPSRSPRSRACRLLARHVSRLNETLQGLGARLRAAVAAAFSQAVADAVREAVLAALAAPGDWPGLGSPPVGCPAFGVRLGPAAGGVCRLRPAVGRPGLRLAARGPGPRARGPPRPASRAGAPHRRRGRGPGGVGLVAAAVCRPVVPAGRRGGCPSCGARRLRPGPLGLDRRGAGRLGPEPVVPERYFPGRRRDAGRLRHPLTFPSHIGC